MRIFDVKYFTLALNRQVINLLMHIDDQLHVLNL